MPIDPDKIGLMEPSPHKRLFLQQSMPHSEYQGNCCLLELLIRSTQITIACQSTAMKSSTSNTLRALTILHPRKSDSAIPTTTCLLPPWSMSVNLEVCFKADSGRVFLARNCNGAYRHELFLSFGVVVTLKPPADLLLVRFCCVDIVKWFCARWVVHVCGSTVRVSAHNTYYLH